MKETTSKAYTTKSKMSTNLSKTVQTTKTFKDM